MDEIRLVKLSTGEELVASVKIGEEGVVQLTKRVILGMNNEGNLGFGKYPLFAAYNNIPVNPAHVVYIVEPAPEIVNAYNAKFGSGIVLATKMPTDKP